MNKYQKRINKLTKYHMWSSLFFAITGYYGTRKIIKRSIQAYDKKIVKQLFRIGD